MKLLILNSFDADGGAAIATHRLHTGLRSAGVNSTLLVQVKNSADYSVIGALGKWQKLFSLIRSRVDILFQRIYRKRQNVIFSTAWFPERIAAKTAELNPDIVHLFWVNSGFLRIETLARLGKPVVWTLHDMWPFTGGCHYDDGCGKFRQECGNCPSLNSGRERDLSRFIFERKRKSWADLPIVVVATSRWIGDMARASALFRRYRIEIIPNGIDTNRYKPADKMLARDVYSLPRDKRLVLFSAFSASSDRRKGGHILNMAIKNMVKSEWGASTELIIVGASKPLNTPDFGMRVHYMGHMRDEISQVLLYSAVDVLVAPSMQENLSNAVMESLSCGTPVVAFDIGGMPDMIDHQMNGYLAKPFDPDDLAAGIVWAIEDKGRRDSLSLQARQSVVRKFAMETVSEQYLKLYQSLL
jgi:glycosyltransferase involved in cell wall biosynthesis